MDVKYTLLVLCLLVALLGHVSADFFYNHPSTGDGLECQPGRTTVRVNQPKPINLPINGADTESDNEFVNSRREHSYVPTDDEECQVCVCSANGMDLYCRNRAAANVNECMMLKSVVEKMSQSPYMHTRDLANRIRRDYLWHNDEIPYSLESKCYRGHSYYTNNPNATESTIADAEVSNFGNNTDICYFCVCSVGGTDIVCISRNVWFCDYVNYLGNQTAIRDMYSKLLQQDRPAYFRQLSWRMRRTMDDGIYDFINAVNDEEEARDGKCVPFVSEYTDCNDENACSGCQKCVCTQDAEWECTTVNFCDEDKTRDERQLELGVVDEALFDNALYLLENEMRKNKEELERNKLRPKYLAPMPTRPTEATETDLLLDFEHLDPENMLKKLRGKRAANKKENKHMKRSVDKINNHTIKFYDTIDELNEDTLKHSNSTGTLHAGKNDNLLPRLSSSSNTSQHIDFNQPKVYHHITDNKIDNDDNSHESIKNIQLGNHTQVEKDKELSKLVVNELKKGNEVIGDNKAPVISNITFTPENDTLTAMAFIAGNLLNKLWNMEKDGSGTSLETETMKKATLLNLMDLFKEPMNLRQETFLKNALQQLSDAVDKSKDVSSIDNISICKNIEKAKKLLEDMNRTVIEEHHTPDKKENVMVLDQKFSETEAEHNRQSSATNKAISKINNVLELLKKYEHIHKNLSALKSGSRLNLRDKIVSPNSSLNEKVKEDIILTETEKNTLNLYGRVLDTITKLLMPQQNHKKISKEIHSHSITKSNENVKHAFKELYDIDLTNMTVTAKDKLILDYMAHIGRNPDCKLNKNHDKVLKKLPTIESNILLNLSEFFKMKSIADLIKLIEPEKTDNALNTTTEKTTILPQTQRMTYALPTAKIQEKIKFESTEEKLKVHLKNILEDLIELQRAKGLTINSGIKIVDALPCIYKILNSKNSILNSGNEEKPEADDNKPVITEKAVKILKDLKQQMNIEQTRRSGVSIVKPRPQSAAVWERIIKNINEVSKPKTRRTFDAKEPKSFDKIKEMITKVSKSSITYKNHALLMEVPASEKLMLLKTFEKGVNNYIKVLEDIKLAEPHLSLPLEHIAEVSDFLDKISSTIKLDSRILNNLEKMRSGSRRFANGLSTKLVKSKPKKVHFIKNNNRFQSPIKYEMQKDQGISISRNLILSQLIKNRIELYLKAKESKEYDFENDMNYNIAKRVLYYLRQGNYSLAKELFKVFVMHDIKPKAVAASKTPGLIEELESIHGVPINEKKTIVQFQAPDPGNPMNWSNQDYLIKQLLNMKNM